MRGWISVCFIGLKISNLRILKLLRRHVLLVRSILTQDKLFPCQLSPQFQPTVEDIQQKMPPRGESEHDEERGRCEAGEETPLMDVSDGQLVQQTNQWTSTFESIGLLSSPLTNPKQVDALTRSPKPGGPSRIRLQRTKYEETYVYESLYPVQLQKTRSLDFGTTKGKGRPPIQHFSKRTHPKPTTPSTKKEEDSKATFAQCVFNMCNTLMGIGLLALPFAIASAGWVAGILVLIGATVVTWYTCLLIGRSMNGDPRPTHFFDESKDSCIRMRSPITGLPQIATEAFGTAGNVLLSAVLYFELFSSLCIFLVTMGDHLYVLFPMLSTDTHTVIVSILLAIPTALLRTPRLLSYMSMVGTSSTIAIVLSVAAAAIIEGDVSQEMVAQEQSETINVQSTHSLWVSSGIALSIGLVAFCYSGHAIIPSFYKSMEKPQEFEKVLSYSYGIVLLCYILVGFSGYYMFGSAVDDQITLSLQRGVSQMGSVMTCLTWLMVSTAFSKATLYIFPLSIGLEEIIAPHLSNEFAVNTASCMIKMTMIVLALLVSLFVPSFGFICSLVGMICTMVVSVIFPAAAHLQLFSSGLSEMEKWLDWLLIGIGIIVAVVGTIAIL